MQTITIGGQPLKTNPAGLVSLTDLHRAAAAQGWTDGKLEPKGWAQTPRAKKSGSSGKLSTSGGPGHDFITFVAENLHVDAADIYQTSKARFDRGGGTCVLPPLCQQTRYVKFHNPRHGMGYDVEDGAGYKIGAHQSTHPEMNRQWLISETRLDGEGRSWTSFGGRMVIDDFGNLVEVQ